MLAKALPKHQTCRAGLRKRLGMDRGQSCVALASELKRTLNDAMVNVSEAFGSHEAIRG